MTVVGYLGALVVGAGLWLIVAGAARRPASHSLRDFLGPVETSVRAAKLQQGLATRLTQSAVDRLGRIGRRITPAARTAALRSRLDNAGSGWSAEVFLAAKAAAVGLGLVAGLAWALLGAPGGAWAVLVGAAAGYAVPELLLANKGSKRQEALTRELPEAFDLLALTVQAGLGFEQALDEVVAETRGPLGLELDRLLKEQQLGRSRREALTALAERNRSDELRTLVAALVHADRLGTPIGDTLKVQARELRRRRRAAARERAGKAPVKLLFPLMFGVFPAMFVVIIGPAALAIVDALIR